MAPRDRHLLYSLVAYTSKHKRGVRGPVQISKRKIKELYLPSQNTFDSLQESKRSWGACVSVCMCLNYRALGVELLNWFGFFQSKLGLLGPRQMALRAKAVLSGLSFYLSHFFSLSYTHTYEHTQTHISFNSHYWHPLPFPDPSIRNHRGPLYFLLTHLARWREHRVLD